MRDKVAWGSATPGQIKTAGLPNIEGKHRTSYVVAGQYGNVSFVEGAFYAGPAIGSAGYPGGIAKSTTVGSDVIAFSASASNPIYGNSSTVQPPAYTVKFLIRALP